MVSRDTILIHSGRAIEARIPRHRWQYHRMRTDTDYSVPGEGRDPIVSALHDLGRFVAAGNTVTAVPRGMLELEWPAFPRLALREALLNAFGHRDYQAPGAVVGGGGVRLSCRGGPPWSTDGGPRRACQWTPDRRG